MSAAESSQGWSFGTEAASLTTVEGVVTLVEGSTFCISSPSGDIEPGSTQGLFLQDTRLLSRLELRLDGQGLEPLSAFVGDPFTATFVARARPLAGQADSAVVALRYRHVGRGMRDELVIRNFGQEEIRCEVSLDLDVDFAGLFEVKEGRVAGLGGWRSFEESGGRLAFHHSHDGVRRGVVLEFTGFDRLEHHRAAARVTIAPQGEWRACVQVAAVVDGTEVEPRYRCGQPAARATPAVRLQRWRRQIPVVRSDPPGLEMVIGRSQEDLGALRMFDPEHPDRTVVAAGAPWFMTLFGRDSVLASWMALLVDPHLALGVLQTLARFQGERIDEATEEEPGRILHEMRFGSSASLNLGGGEVYYGTVDATPLFVMLLGEMRRWGLAAEQVDALLPHVDRALDWVAGYGDRDGDGFVEYLGGSGGLRNQGWKDSWDGVRFADGRLGEGPIALCEVQGYVYAAYVARAHFAHEAGDAATAEDYRARATALKEEFNRRFWLEDRGWYAMGLDGDKAPLDALTSNVGHCLWTGIVDRDKAPLIASRLMSHEMFSGWGVRTLANNMTGYNPISYHNGSVWPHDNAIVAAGLMRYGFVEEALRVVAGLLEAATAFGGRLPELFGGLDRSDLAVPLTYPASCSPQAWAAATPLQLLRTVLRLDPWLPQGKVWLDPVLPSNLSRLRVEGIPLGGARVSVEVEGDDVSIDGLPPGVEVVRRAREPLSAELLAHSDPPGPGL